jgi:DNA-directed RNA polymerase specialized sigma24 family protein
MELQAQWIEQARQGDAAARESLSAWCLRRAYRFAFVALGRVPNRQTVAEEIAGEASLLAVTHLDQFEPGTCFDPWLHQLVRNCVRGFFRKEDRALPFPLYQRWVHEFLHAYGPELEALIRSEYGKEA